LSSGEIMPEKGTLRREPRQGRGARRVERILDAAAAVFAEQGYEATTTNAIAARAETSIGSLYQFFPNKEAIGHALARRYLDQLQAVYAHVLDDTALSLPLDSLLDRIIDTLAAFYAAHPGFGPIFSATEGSAELRSAAQTLQDNVVRRAEEILTSSIPDLSPARRRLHATLIAGVIRALLPLTVAEDGSPREDVIAELKRMLTVYIVVGIKGTHST
jgi:AcrR family transcriptional regulator